MEGGKKYCQVRSSSMQPHAYAMTNFIGPNTTVREFEDERVTYPAYQIWFGGRCGWNVAGAAAYEGNSALLHHLLSKYGKQMGYIGNEFGWTPMFCATQCDSEENALKCVKVLLDFDVDPDICTSSSSFDTDRGGTPKGITPLQNCINRKKHPKIIDLLQQQLKEEDD